VPEVPEKIKIGKGKKFFSGHFCVGIENELKKYKKGF